MRVAINLRLDRHIIIFSLLCSLGRIKFVCVFHLYLLTLKVIPRIFKEVTVGIWMLLHLILQVQWCFLHMWRCWHLNRDSDAPE